MRINKENELWKISPWYIKFGTYGVKTYAVIRILAAGCAIAAILALLVRR